MTIYNREDYRTVLPQMEKQFNKSIDEANKRIDESNESISKNIEVKTATVNGSTGALYFYRTGNVVFVSTYGAFRSSSSSIASGTTLTQKTPQGFTPIANTYISAVHNASNNWRLEFDTNRNISFLGSTAWNGNLWLCGVWITSDEMLE